MRRVPAACVAVAAVLAAAGCTTTPASNAPRQRLLVGVDLPFQGAAAKASEEAWNAMRLYLDQSGGTVGRFAVVLKRYDDATAARGAWDEPTCRANAQDHLGTTTEVAVIGLPNAGCAKAEVPVLNADPGGAMLAVSHAVSDPALTRPWGTSSPADYAASGVRSFARVTATDDTQAVAAARFAAQTLTVKRCFVLNNGEAYGAGLSAAFVAEARRLGIDVAGERSWQRSESSYAGLFTSAAKLGVDCVYLAGNFDDNGGQLVADKVAVLGDNTAVRLLAPDGFAGYPELLQLAAAQGAFLTGVGRSLESLRTSGDTAANLLTAYQSRYSAPVASASTLYAVLALQVVLAAVKASDGTRKGVRDAVFTGSGVRLGKDVSVVGMAVAIDPKTGDVTSWEISVTTVNGRQEQAVGPVAVP